MTGSNKGQEALDLEPRDSKFERDFLRRTLGEVVKIPDVALTELVANSWDAGASKVEVFTPPEDGDQLVVQDDGCGLTEDQFNARWMTLAYDRRSHQGPLAEFPPERSDWQRRVFGRNGQGRHGLLCFNDEYDVETWRDGRSNTFSVRVNSGEAPLQARHIETADREGHGTRLRVRVARNRPDSARIRELLSARFLQDPQFTISVDGESLELTDLPGLIEQTEFEVREDVHLKLICVEGDNRRTKHQSGVAFWVGNRLVGEASWTVGRSSVLDGRTRPGRMLTFILQTNDLFDEVRPDWTGFRSSELMDEVYEATRDQVMVVLRRVLRSRVAETRHEVMDQVHERLGELSGLEQVEVAEMVEAVTEGNPLASTEVVSEAVSGLIEAKKNRSVQALVSRILTLPDEDIEGLTRLLDEWSIRDALTVLDEVGRRIRTIETIEKLMGERGIDELHVIHPLVTQARWLFGPEFESPLYASNVTIRKAIEKVLGDKLAASSFDNPRKRPDLMFLADSTLSAVAAEDFDEPHGVARLRTVLLIELKRSGFSIGRDEMNQAAGYVEDLLTSDLVEGTPHVHAFVVGHEVSSRIAGPRTVGENQMASIRPMTFGQLVRSANARLFRIRETVSERYPESGLKLVGWLQERPEQMEQLGIRFRKEAG